MPRVVVPSPNEELHLLQQAQQKQKLERLKAVRKQATDWSKRRTATHKAICQEKSIIQKRQDVKVKLNNLSAKECALKSELEEALGDVGKSYNGAEQLTAQQLDKGKADEMAAFSARAAQRHRDALKRLNKLREESENKENRIRELKVKVKEDERERTKTLLENTTQVSQPLIDIPTHKVQKQLNGLDAFTKTYFHLPTGIGIVDEKSLDPNPGKSARDLAKETDGRMGEFDEKLRESKQAREERADVRGASALQKVQLNNILEDITSRLDKYAVYKRTRKSRSNPDVNIFASNLARAHAKKKHQVELEQAVEDIFDDKLDLLLPNSALFKSTSLDIIDEKSETSVTPDPLLDKSELDDTVRKAGDNDNAESDEDNLPAASRPSLNLYFPLCSDISSLSEPTPDRSAESRHTYTHDANHTTNIANTQTDQEKRSHLDQTPTTNNLEKSGVSEQSSGAYKSDISALSEHSTSHSIHSHKSSILLSSTLDSTQDHLSLQESLTLSDKIEKQIEINKKLTAMKIGSPVKIITPPISETDQPPPISFTKTSPNTSSFHSSNVSQGTLSSLSTSKSYSTPSSTSVYSDRIVQEILTSDPESVSPIHRVQNSVFPLQRDLSPLQKHISPVRKFASTLQSSVYSPGLQDRATLQNSVSPGLQDPEVLTLSGCSSDDISQRALSNSDSSKGTPGNYSNVSSNYSKHSNISKVGDSSGDDSVLSKVSVSSGLSNLQRQLQRITAHLREIEQIKANDDKLLLH